MRTHRHALVHVQTQPAATGFTATLELYSRWRYRWRSRRSVKLDSRGAAAFRLPASSRALARVALSRKRRGPALVHSGVVKLRNGRHAADPDAIPSPGHGAGHG